MMGDKLNLVLYKNSFYVGGAEKQLILLANHISREQFNVHVLACETHENAVKQMSGDVNFLKLARTNLFRHVLMLRAFLRKNSIHICQAWDFRSSIVGFWATRLMRTKFIDGSLRSAPGKNIKRANKAFWKQRLKVFFFSFLGIPLLANSNAGLKSYGLDNYTHAAVIYNGFDPGEKKRYKNNKKEPELQQPGSINVCMLANMRWKKDFLTFIKAGLEVLAVHPHTYFYLMGDGPDKQKYMDFLKENPFKTNFIFTGFVEDAPAYIRDMDICVLCNDVSGEGLSNSIMEYMACKKPVIATDMGGNPELVIDKETGFLVAEKDYQELCAKILYLINSPVEREKMGERGYQRLLDSFAVRAMVHKYEGFWKDLLKGKG